MTALAGRNGCGKSTILALCVLGFHGVQGHVPLNATARSPKERLLYYTFPDFFHQGPDDPSIAGIQITWEYGNITTRRAKSLEIQKQTQRWMRYARRPPRPVDYVGLARCLPAVEMRTLKAVFQPKKRPQYQNLLSEKMLKRLKDILGISYEEARLYKKSRHSVRSCRINQGEIEIAYSSFNMGAGEDSIAQLLWVLDRAPEGSLIAIEEVEVAIYPEALRRFMTHLLEIARDKALQIIMSTHSEIVLDSVPREARVYLERHSSKHRVMYGPSVEYAVGKLEGRSKPEVRVCCEDRMAQRLIEYSLPHELRTRVAIQPIGGWQQVVEAIGWSMILGEEVRTIGVVDGDVDRNVLESKINKVGCMHGLSKENIRSRITQLPGNAAPERFLIDSIRREEAEDLARTWQIELSALEVIIGEIRNSGEHHDMIKRLAERIGVDPRDCEKDIVLSVVRTNKELCMDIKERIGKAAGLYGEAKENQDGAREWGREAECRDTPGT